MKEALRERIGRLFLSLLNFLYDVQCERDQLTWSNLIASMMERVHNTPDMMQTRMTKPSNTSR